MLGDRANINARVAAKLKGVPTGRHCWLRCSKCGQACQGRASLGGHAKYCYGVPPKEPTKTQISGPWSKGLTKETDARLAVQASKWEQKLPDEVVFIEHSIHPSVAIRRAKRRLPEICALCGIGPEWQGKPLVLRLDHVDGNKRDNRWDNLRKVCPNCDSQLVTFCARNWKRVRELRAQGVNI